MGGFAIIVNSWKPLTIITKCSILDVAAFLEPLLVKEVNMTLRQDPVVPVKLEEPNNYNESVRGKFFANFCGKGEFAFVSL